LRIAFITPSLSRKAGGLFHSVRRLAQSLQATPGTTVDVVALEDEFTKADLIAWEPLKPYHNAVFGPRALGYAPLLAATLRHLDPDLTNANGLWTYSSIVALRWSKRTRRPHVIAPRGMLDPWALNNSRWKKALAERLYEGAHLHAAHCLHGLNITEAKTFRAFGLRNPICIVPNGVDLPSGAATAAPPWQDAVPKGQRVLLYLGRIHLKKGLLNLVRAWESVASIAKREGWCLVIAGWD
jgi:glycosyltransferase involved in cell wall biosynthesis